MSIALALLMALGVLANVVGALCIILPCLAWLGFMAWVLTTSGEAE